MASGSWISRIRSRGIPSRPSGPRPGWARAPHSPGDGAAESLDPARMSSRPNRTLATSDIGPIVAERSAEQASSTPQRHRGRMNRLGATRAHPRKVEARRHLDDLERHLADAHLRYRDGHGSDDLPGSGGRRRCRPGARADERGLHWDEAASDPPAATEISRLRSSPREGLVLGDHLSPLEGIEPVVQ